MLPVLFSGGEEFFEESAGFFGDVVSRLPDDIQAFQCVLCGGVIFAKGIPEAIVSLLHQLYGFGKFLKPVQCGSDIAQGGEGMPGSY